MTESRPLAVVTGASGGIGRELARQFATSGFDLVVAAEDDEVAAAVDDLADSEVEIQVVWADLGTDEGAERVVKAIAATGRPVDALALDAGVSSGGAFTDVPLAAEQRLIGVNIGSTIHLAKAIVPDMARRGAGRVLFVSSTASQLPGPFYATYAASQAFIHSFAAALRDELEDTGVTVTALLPAPGQDDPAGLARDGFEAMMAGQARAGVRATMTRPREG